MDISAQVVVLVVGFRNAADVQDCLHALARAEPEPSFEVFIAENGGPAGMDWLLDMLAAAGSPCHEAAETLPEVHAPAMLRRRCFRLIRPDGADGPWVHVAEMSSNLGYAGAINAWLGPLLQVGGWQAAWILNPDTEPMPSALAELMTWSRRRGCDMVGSRLIPTVHADRVHSRGLAWRRLAACTLAVDYHAPAGVEPDPDAVEARLSAPSGASCYVTRRLIEWIGLMDDRYFLYFEDLEWGLRARRLGPIGYAHASVVPHKGGTTIGAGGTRSAMSRMAVYLEIRNRILFVRKHCPAWLPWTVLMQCVHVVTFGAVGAFGNMRAAGRGLIAGIAGETGRPDHILQSHRR